MYPTPVEIHRSAQGIYGYNAFRICAIGLLRHGASCIESVCKEKTLTVDEDWVERARAKGEFTGDMPSRFAAIYIDAQLNNALSVLAHGEPNDEVKQILTVGFFYAEMNMPAHSKRLRE